MAQKSALARIWQAMENLALRNRVLEQRVVQAETRLATLDRGDDPGSAKAKAERVVKDRYGARA